MLGDDGEDEHEVLAALEEVEGNLDAVHVQAPPLRLVLEAYDQMRVKGEVEVTEEEMNNESLWRKEE